MTLITHPTIPNVILTDELLDRLAANFQTYRVREITGASFEDYLRDTTLYESLAVRLAAGLRLGRGA